MNKHALTSSPRGSVQSHRDESTLHSNIKYSLSLWPFELSLYMLAFSIYLYLRHWWWKIKNLTFKQCFITRSGILKLNTSTLEKHDMQWKCLWLWNVTILNASVTLLHEEKTPKSSLCLQPWQEVFSLHAVTEGSNVENWVQHIFISGLWPHTPACRNQHRIWSNHSVWRISLLH